MSTEIERLHWVVVDPRERGCTLGIWEPELGLDRMYDAGPFACDDVVQEWYGMRVRGCDQLADVLLSDGVVGDTPGATSCGTGRIALSADPLVDTSQAHAVEGCFAKRLPLASPPISPSTWRRHWSRKHGNTARRYLGGRRRLPHARLTHANICSTIPIDRQWAAATWRFVAIRGDSWRFK